MSSVSEIVNGLSQHFRTPQEALASFYAFDAMLKGKRAKDEEEAEDPAQQLFALLKGKLSPEELERVGELLSELSGAGEESEEGERADGDDRPGLKDHDEFEEDEEPGAAKYTYDPDKAQGGGIDFGSRNISRVQTVRKVPAIKKIGEDSAAKIAFDQRFPNLQRIDTTLSLFYCTPDRPAPRPKTREYTARDEARFQAMFPALGRVS